MSENPRLSIVPRLPQELARQDAIQALEEMLDLAKKGEIVAVSIVGLRPDRTASTSISDCNEPLAMVGALRIHAAAYEQDVLSCNRDGL